MSGRISAPIEVSGYARDATYIDTYANQLRLGATLNDVTIVFSVTDDMGPGHFVNKDKVAVHLSPGTVKLLLSNLQAVVAAYEKALGPIPMPANLPARLLEVQEGFAKNLAEQLNAPLPTRAVHPGA